MYVLCGQHLIHFLPQIQPCAEVARVTNFPIIMMICINSKYSVYTTKYQLLKKTRNYRGLVPNAVICNIG